MKPIRIRIRAAGAALLLAALAGCVSLGGGGKPPRFLLSLAAEKPVAAGTMASGTAATTIVVMEPDTSQKLAVLRVPVQVSDTSVAYLVDATWVERPARLFRGLIAETLRTRTTALVLEDSQPAAPGGQRLGGQLVDMGYDARSGAVVVRYDALRTMPDGTVQSRRFEAVVPGVPAKAEFVGPALNQAANDVARQVAEWMLGG
ncbi:MAG: ABC transporter [Novosphingobium sp.]|uniref:ABC-type transport auxiliary lipoprotein family protein n=1 Tax=Novosphingobium sp. TaxID=1874826 RepID=UPI0032BA41FE